MVLILINNSLHIFLASENDLFKGTLFHVLYFTSRFPTLSSLNSVRWISPDAVFECTFLLRVCSRARCLRSSRTQFLFIAGFWREVFFSASSSYRAWVWVYLVWHQYHHLFGSHLWHLASQQRNCWRWYLTYLLAIRYNGISIIYT